MKLRKLFLKDKEYPMKKLYAILHFSFVLFVVSAQNPVLIDINPGSGSSNASAIGVLNNNLLVGISNPSYQLWKTDGSPIGTQAVTNINAFTTQTGIALNNKLIFAADGGSGIQPWVTDGTSGGTAQLKLINTVDNSSPREFTPLNNKVLFVATDSFYLGPYISILYGLWTTDATTAGTQKIYEYKRVDADGVGCAPGQLTPFNNKVYFLASDSFQVPDIWVTDGTTGGTHKVVNNPTNTRSYITNIIMNNNFYMHTVDYVSNQNRLWKIDVTNGTSTLVKDMGNVSSAYTEFTVFNNIIYFNGPNGLWTSDGTSAGSNLVKPFSSVYNFVLYNNKVFFSASDVNGNSLWSTDGTIGGTVKVKSLGTNQGWLDEAIIYNNRMYLVSADNSTRTFWQSTGDSLGTISLGTETAGQPYVVTPNFRIANGSLFFTGELDNNGIELWKITTTTLGIEETEINLDLTIYPNPANDKLFTETNGTEIEQVNIYNTTGSLVMAASSIINHQLSIENLATGVYIAEIKTKEGSVRKRWVKM